MKNVSNIGNIPSEYIDEGGFPSVLKTVMIGDALGSEKLYVNMDFLSPGAKSAKYHSHSSQEEFFLILGGEGILRMDGEETTIRAGDCISKPAGRTHQFINNGSEILQILDVGTREKDDVILYPDENTVYIKKHKLVFRLQDKLEDWTSDPDA